MQRVLVVGCAGAGKSTFGRRLAATLDLPLFHLDQHFWRPGWQTPEPQEWRDQVVALAGKPAWIMDGNYANTFDIRMPRADTLIWLGHPRSACMRRVLTRMLAQYGRTRSDLPENCPGRFDLAFLRYVWTFQEQQRPRLENGIKTFGGHQRLVVLRDDRDATSFLAHAGSA
jgi:adenylate kinase family enzyme